MMNRFERSGDIREVDLLAALVVLWREKASVTLDFTRTGVTGGFDISDGDVVATFSADPRFENAAILVRAGKLEPAALERLAAPEGSDRAMAAMQAGVLTRREWKWGEKIRAIEVLSDLLTWNDGRYLAEPDTRSVSGEFRLPIPRLVLELFLRSRDRALVDHQLGSPDAPLERSEDFEKEFSTFGLTADAESVVRLIDGQATARQIAVKAPADAFAVEKLLAALVTLGLLRPSPEPEGDSASPTVRVAAAPPAELPPAALDVERDPLDVEIEGTAADLSDFPEVQAGPELEIAPEPARSFTSSPLDAADRFEADTLDAGPVAAELPASAAEWDTLAPGPPDPILERTVEPEAERSGGRQGPILLAVFAALAIAVAAVLLLRSWPGATTLVSPERTAAAAAPTTGIEVAKPTDAPPATVLAPRPTDARARAVPAATAAPAKATAAPTPAPTPAPAPTRAAAVAPGRPVLTARPAAAPAGPERKPWLDRAESDRRRLASEPGSGTRYAVQLLLACEVPTLVDAWKHDQPAGSLWLQTTDHQGRTCFRVFWGRFATAEEARRAKDRVPGYFVTPSNRPAVVAVR